MNIKQGGGGDGGAPIFSLDPAVLEPEYNYDFTHQTDDGTVYKRGERDYQRPLYKSSYKADGSPSPLSLLSVTYLITQSCLPNSLFQ